MKIFPLGPKVSDWIVTVYVIATLYLRFMLEPQLNGHFLVSIALGAFALLFLWALVKSKVLNPTFFGMYKQAEPANGN
ncbi:MAG: hypothetical protein KDC54_07300 [Lewinella sp.]|nr:hypothetical protein [Lewinella sp.]